MHILLYILGGREGHTPKSCCPLRCTLLSRGDLKNLMLRSFTFVCQLYCCSSKRNNNKALRITFNSCKTVSTSSMALATINIDKFIKVTSASSYVYCHPANKIYWTKTAHRQPCNACCVQGGPKKVSHFQIIKKSY